MKRWLCENLFLMLYAIFMFIHWLFDGTKYEKDILIKIMSIQKKLIPELS